jgi:hypothetical protein
MHWMVMVDRALDGEEESWIWQAYSRNKINFYSTLKFKRHF